MMPPFFNFLRSDDIPSSARQNYRHERRFYLFWVLLAGCVNPDLNAIVAKKTFGASDTLTAFIWAIPILANILNVAWGSFCRGRRRVQMMSLVCAIVALSVSSLAFTPHTFRPWSGYIFAGQLVLTFFFWTGLITLRTSIWQVNYPDTHRPKITGRMQMIRMLSMVIIPISLGTLYDKDPTIYRLVYPAAGIFGLLSVLQLRKIIVANEEAEIAEIREELKEGDTNQRGSFWQGVRDTFAILVNDPVYRSYLIAQFLLGSANFFTEPTLILFATTELELGYARSTAIITALRTTIVLLSTPIWSNLYSRITIFKFRVFNSGFWVAAHSIMAFTLVGYAVGWIHSAWIAISLIALARIVAGVGHGGGMIAFPLGHLAFSKGHQANLYLGAHVALAGVRGSTMPMLATGLVSLVGFSAILVSPILSLGGHLFYRRLQKQDDAKREIVESP